MKNQITFAVIDDEIEIREIISFYLENEVAKNYPINVKLFENPRSLLDQTDFSKSFPYDFILCDNLMPQMSGEEFYSVLLDKKVETNFILVAGKKPSNPLFLDGNLYQGYIQKPKIIEGLKTIFEKINFDKYFVAINQDYVTAHKTDYIKIPIKMIKMFQIIPSDLYLVLGKEKAVKIFLKGDMLTPEDYASLEKKEVEYLYVNFYDSHTISEAIEEKLLLLTKENHDFPIENKISSIYNVVHSISNIFSINKEFSSLISSSINSLTSQIKDSDAKYLILNLLNNKDSYLTQHSFLTLFISNILCSQLKWSNESTLQRLTFAAIFHDIALTDFNLNEKKELKEVFQDQAILKDSAVSKMNPLAERQKLFMNHVGKAIQIINKIKETPLGVDKIILEHHEDPFSKGFPRQLSPQNISPISATFILSHHLAQTIIEMKDEGIELSDNNVRKKIAIEDFEKGNYKEAAKAFLSIKLFN